MHLLNSWFLKHRERQERFASLNDLMFAESRRHYPKFRLSLFNFQVIFQFFAHAILFYFMFHELGRQTFTFVIYLSSWKILVTAMWWGGLELLRSHVRYAYRAGNVIDAERAIGFWLILTGIVCIPLLAAASYTGYVAYHNYLYHMPFQEWLFASFICLSLVVRLPVSTYHSGIYGITRVIRPHFSVIMAYTFGLLVLILTWPIFHIYSVFLAILTQSLVSSYLTYHYAAYMYQLYNFLPKKPDKRVFKELLKKISPLHFLLASLANIFMISDALLIIGFYYFSRGDSNSLLFIQIIYLISPLIQASSNWARLFYFDRKKLQNTQMNVFINEYDRTVAFVASFMGATFGIYSFVACTFLISYEAGIYVLTMIPFFLLRSMVANLQIREFSNFYYLDVIASGMILIGGLVAIYLLSASLFFKSLYVAILMIIVHAFLKRNRFPQFQSTRYQGLYTNLYSWMTHLKSNPEFVEVYRLHLDPYIKLAEKIVLIRTLSEELGLTEYQVCSIKEQYILLFRRVGKTRELLPRSFFADLGGGLIHGVDRNLISEVTLYIDDTYFSYSFDQSPIITDLYQFAFRFVSANEKMDENSVVEIFMDSFPEGTYYNPHRNTGPEAEPLKVETVRKFSSLVWQYLFKARKRMKTDIDVSVLYENDYVKVIFVIPKQEDENFNERLQKWHNYIHAVNLKHAIT